jgi:hypothetical protein
VPQKLRDYSFEMKDEFPQGLKPSFLRPRIGTAEEAAEKLESRVELAFRPALRVIHENRL